MGAGKEEVGGAAAAVAIGACHRSFILYIYTIAYFDIYE